MEQHEHRRRASASALAGLRNLGKAITDAVGNALAPRAHRQRAGPAPRRWAKADALDRPAPDRGRPILAADIPGPVAKRAGLHHRQPDRPHGRVAAQRPPGKSDWDAGRRALAGPPPGVRRRARGVRFPSAVLSRRPRRDDLAVTVDPRHVGARPSERADLLLDLQRRDAVHANQAPAASMCRLRFVVNGAATTAQGDAQGKPGGACKATRFPSTRRSSAGGAASSCPPTPARRTTCSYFVFDEPPGAAFGNRVRRSRRKSGAAGRPRWQRRRPTPTRTSTPPPVCCRCKRAAEIPVGGHGAHRLAGPDPETRRMTPWRGSSASTSPPAGRSMFLPPESPGDDTSIFGLRTGGPLGRAAPATSSQAVEWWRNDAGLLANTRDGAALPVGTLEISRRCGDHRRRHVPWRAWRAGRRCCARRRSAAAAAARISWARCPDRAHRASRGTAW